MIICQACGTENPPDATFCSHCARKLDPDTQGAVVRQRQSHTATGIRWTAIAVTAAIVIIAAIVLAIVVAYVV